MSSEKGRLDLICEQVGIRIRPVTRRRKGPETHARETLRRLMHKYGEGHLVLVLKCIRESKNNAGEAWSENINAISDVLLLKPEWGRERAGELLDAMDHIDLGTLRKKHKDRRPWPLRDGIRTDLLNHLEAQLNDSAEPTFDGI
ncbi:MAG: hypothetical protein COB93_02475 [Sneathiella sp.]|nr:MAG: hypothetical protein COB93_02475 [Sneathiella sp.]